MPSDVGSAVSAGDVHMFLATANPDKLATHRAQQLAASTMRAARRDHDHSHDDSDDSSAGSERRDARRDDEDDVEEVDSDDASQRQVENAESDDSDAEVDDRSGGAAARRASPVMNADLASRMGKYQDYVETQRGTRVREESENALLEKQSILLDMERLKLQGIKLSKEWSVEDSVEDMRFEVKRLMLACDEANNVNTMRSSLQLACTGLEMASQRWKLLDLSGWSEEVCRDMHKYDQSLGLIYRRYWRRGPSQNPEMDILLGLASSAGMYHFRRSLTRSMFPASQRGGGDRRSARSPQGFRSRARADESDIDDEDLPP